MGVRAARARAGRGVPEPAPRLHPAHAPRPLLRGIPRPHAARLDQLQLESGLRPHVPARGPGRRLDPAHVPQPRAPLRERRARVTRVRGGQRAVSARVREQGRLRSSLPRPRLPRSRGELRRAGPPAFAGRAAAEGRKARLAAARARHRGDAVSPRTDARLELRAAGHARAGLSAARFRSPAPAVFGRSHRRRDLLGRGDRRFLGPPALPGERFPAPYRLESLGPERAAAHQALRGPRRLRAVVRLGTPRRACRASRAGCCLPRSAGCATA